MEIARLRHRVTVEQPFRLPDELGGQVTTWQTVKTIWAEVRPMSGKEKVEAQQWQSTLSHVIATRYYPWLNSSMRIRWQKRIFHVHAV